MREISSFELIFKPQSPQGPADRVLQGYFLNISNLEDVDLFFRLDFFISSVSDPDRSLQGNTVAFIDGPSQNNVPGQLVGGLSSKSFRLSPFVTVPAHGTAKVGILPSDPFTPNNNEEFEARGYATIRLPGRFARSPIRFEPQVNGEARVLLTPQNRATYLTPSNTVNGQTQSSLPTAMGRAVIEVPAERFPFPVIISPDALERPELSLAGRLNDLSADDLALLLAAMSASDINVDAFNASLREAGIEMTLGRRSSGR